MARGRQSETVWRFVRENVFPAGPGRLSLVALILANVIPLVGVLFLGWDAAALVLIYWSENLVAGFYGILKIALLRVEKPVEHLGKLFIVPFFCIHYGGFCAIHGLFLVAFFKIGDDPGPPSGSWPCLLVFVELLIGVVIKIWKAAPDVLFWPFVTLMASHGVSFVQNYLLGGESRSRDPQQLMIGPYKRIVVLHVAIIAGGMFTMVLGSPRPLLVVLVSLKTGLDLFFHNRSHKPKSKAKRKRKKRKR